MKALLVLSAVAISANAWAGFVTPTELTITFTRLSLIKATDNKQLTLLSGSYAHTFKKSDSDFATVSLSNITAPAGRFGGVNICYNSRRQVKISGETYSGFGGAISDGAQLWTTGTSATATGAVVTSAPTGGATTVDGYIVGNQDNECSSTYFATPVCVSADAAKCVTGDVVVNPGTSVPNMNLILDLYDAIGIDASNSALYPIVANYPYATIGSPGAAVHLLATSSGKSAHVSLIFSGDKKLIYGSAFGTGGISGFCSGVPAVSATAGPVINPYGPSWVQSYSATTGIVEMATGNCGTSQTCTSNGLLVINPSVAGTTTIGANQPFTVSCSADTTGALGYTYSGGPGSAGSVALTAVKVIDPANLFGGGCTPGCGSYP